MTGTAVSEHLSRRHAADQAARIKDELAVLRNKTQLAARIRIPDAAVPLEITADISRRCIDVGMAPGAPEDKTSAKARVNWLLRQIRTEQPEDLHLRLLWPGKSDPSQHLVSELRADPDKAGDGKGRMAPHAFFVFHSRHLGAQFAKQGHFISQLEQIVPAFYREVGSHLTAWKRKAPKIKEERASAEDVTTEAISEDAQACSPDGTPCESPHQAQPPSGADSGEG